MKKVLITGCSGQIGSKLINLLKKEFEVIGLDISLSNNKDIEFIKCDLLDKESLLKYSNQLKDVTILVHLASIVESSRDPKHTKRTFMINSVATSNIISILPSLKHIVYASSMMVYGRPIHSPIDENHPLSPLNLYGVSKAYTEDLLRINSLNKKIIVTSLRLTSIYGPGNYSGQSATRAIPNFIRLAKKRESPVIFGKINEKRDYLFIDDATHAIYLAVKTPYHGPLNIGSGASISIQNLADEICSIINSGVKPIVKDPNPNFKDDYLLDISKAKEMIGFTTNIDIREGLRREING